MMLLVFKLEAGARYACPFQTANYCDTIIFKRERPMKFMLLVHQRGAFGKRENLSDTNTSESVQ